MFDTPEASPTWLARTAAVAADEAGPLDNPIPTATAISGRTKATYPHELWLMPMTANPTAVIANPAPTTDDHRTWPPAWGPGAPRQRARRSPGGG